MLDLGSVPAIPEAATRWSLVLDQGSGCLGAGLGESPSFNHLCMLSHSVVPNSLRPVDCSPPGSFVHGILQARTLEWVAISFFWGSSPSKDQIHVSYISCVSSQILDHWATCLVDFMKIHWRRDSLPTPVFSGFPCGSAGKESICNVGDLGWEIPWRREWLPTPVFWALENSMDCMSMGSQRVGHDWETFTS